VLLLGLGEFDVAQTVELAVNGVSSTHRLQPSVEVLMKWAIRDGDPELLVAEEIEILAEP
jgi:hypothetical protein